MKNEKTEREKDAKYIKYVSLIERRKEGDQKRKGERKKKLCCNECLTQVREMELIKRTKFSND